MRLRLCLFIILLISLRSPGDLKAQNMTPRIVDTLIHYRLGNDQGDPAFWKSIFWWSGVTSPHTPAGEHDVYERLVFGSDAAGGDLQEFDVELARYHKMLDACGVSRSTQDMIFAGTMLHLLATQK
jgi:hypothetical protein